jgi:hypothetical protein
MSTRVYLKVGAKVKCLFQNSDHALDGRIFSINFGNRTVEIIYDYGIYEKNVPLNCSKFILKYESDIDIHNYMLCRKIILPHHKSSYIVQKCDTSTCHLLSSTNMTKITINTNTALLYFMQQQLVELKKKQVLFSYPSIIDSYHPNLIQHTGGKIEEYSYDGPCSGYSVVFSLLNESKSKLECGLIHQKTTIHQLSSKSCIHFIVNTNLHRLPSACTSALIAYTDLNITCEKVRSKKEGCHVWNLGIILFHHMKKTIIVPVTVESNKISGSTKFLFNHSKYEEFDYNRKRVSIRFLNIIGQKNKTLTADGIVHMKVDGPDTIKSFPIKQKHVFILRSCRKKYLNHVKVSSLDPSLGSNYYLEKSHLNSMLLSKFGQSNYHYLQHKKSICPSGCSVIAVKGTKQSLSCHSDSSNYMVPLDVGEENGFNSLDYMTYVFLNKENLLKLLSHENMHIDDYYEFLEQHNESVIRLKIVDPYVRHKKGFLIEFIESKEGNSDVANNEDFDYSFSEYITQKPTEHCEFKGTILSHWYSLPEQHQINITQDDIDLINEVYGSTGFGSRNSIKSLGLNVYTGIKNSTRAIPQPGILKEDVILSQINRTSFNDTYNPLLQTFINRLTTQAAEMFSQADRFYNRFLIETSKKLKQTLYNVDSNNNQRGNEFDHRGPLCVLSILTMGKNNNHSKLDGFINQPHLDSGDDLFMDLRNIGHALLYAWLEEDDIEESMKENIHYYFRLFNIGIKKCIPLPTSCGYQILNTEKKVADNIDLCSLQELDDETFVSFALIGLGLTVRIRSGLYHYFFASIFTHCTPLVVTVRNERVYMSTKHLNTIGWGSSSSTGTTSFQTRSKRQHS